MAPLGLLAALAAVAPAGPVEKLRGTSPLPAAVQNADGVFGFVYQPAYSLDGLPRSPAEGYVPQPGDLLCMTNQTPLFEGLYRLAGTAGPGHAGLVFRLPDGNLGLFEAGFNSTAWTRASPLEWRLNEYPGTIWVRRRCVPITDAQSCRLSEFVALSADMRYNTAKFASQIFPFRCRGPIRTFFVGKPIGPGKRYFCAQALVEALVYAGLADAATARPAAVYPEELFFDTSRNPYLKRHPPLPPGGWEVPRLWTRCPTGAACAYRVVPYTAYPRPGVFVPPPGIVQPTPPPETKWTDGPAAAGGKR
jgi:hypothetical protein